MVSENPSQSSPNDRLVLQLAREGYAPERIADMVSRYHETLGLALSGKINAAKESCTPDVLTTWDLHRLDMGHYADAVSSRANVDVQPIRDEAGRVVDFDFVGANGVQVQQVSSGEQLWPFLHSALMEEDGLNPGNASTAIADFADFLRDAQKTDAAIEPSATADIAWHRLILHPREYGEMCTSLFGRMIYHVPALESLELSGCMGRPLTPRPPQPSSCMGRPFIPSPKPQPGPQPSGCMGRPFIPRPRPPHKIS